MIVIYVTYVTLRYVQTLMKFHSLVELHDLYPSPNIISLIITRRMSWAVHVARMNVMGKLYTGSEMWYVSTGATFPWL